MRGVMVPGIRRLNDEVQAPGSRLRDMSAPGLEPTGLKSVARSPKTPWGVYRAAIRTNFCARRPVPTSAV